MFYIVIPTIWLALTMYHIHTKHYFRKWVSNEYNLLIFTKNKETLCLENKVTSHILTASKWLWIPSSLQLSYLLDFSMFSLMS